MRSLPASRYLGTGPLVTAGLRLLGKDAPVPLAIGLERDGRHLMKALCPPHFSSMTQGLEIGPRPKIWPQRPLSSEPRRVGLALA